VAVEEVEELAAQLQQHRLGQPRLLQDAEVLAVEGQRVLLDDGRGGAEEARRVGVVGRVARVLHVGRRRGLVVGRLREGESVEQPEAGVARIVAGEDGLPRQVRPQLRAARAGEADEVEEPAVAAAGDD
jgi:hypothetical protein